MNFLIGKFPGVLKKLWVNECLLVEFLDLFLKIGKIVYVNESSFRAAVFGEDDIFTPGNFFCQITKFAPCFGNGDDV